MKKTSSMELIDMVKFNYEQLEQEAHVLLQTVHENISEGELRKAMTNLWYLSGTINKLIQKTESKNIKY